MDLLHSIVEYILRFPAICFVATFWAIPVWWHLYRNAKRWKTPESRRVAVFWISVTYTSLIFATLGLLFAFGVLRPES